MHVFTIVFLTLLATHVLVLSWLAARQRGSLRAHRDAVPAAFAGHIALQTHRKAADYGVARTGLEQAELALGAALILGWTLGGGLEWLDHAWRAAGWGPRLTGTAVVLSAMLIMSALELPLEVYRTFVIENRYGFNRTTPGLYAADLVKQGVLAAVLGFPLIWLLLTFMAQAGRLWWLYGWMLWTGFTVLLIWAYPQFIAPLFNRFTPLADPALRERIVRLLARSGFRAGGIYVMDGSRRSGHGNAYFTGLGAAKRIVFFDTLLTTLNPREIEAVLAHELGHFKHRHVHQQLLLSTALSFAAFAVLGWLARESWFYQALGVAEPAPHLALILFVLVAPVFGFALAPLGAYWRRRHEFQADRYAAGLTGAQALIDALVKLYRDNAASLTPDPLYSGYHDSHPPAPVRIASLRATLATD